MKLNLTEILHFIGNHTFGQNWNLVKYLVKKYTSVYRRNFYLSYKPLRLAMIITYRCNLRCNFCGIFSIQPDVERKYSDMRFDLYREVVAKFKNAYALSLGGGEPFLHKDIFKMVKYGRMFRMDVALSSNGTLISDKIKQIISSDFSLLNISLNAQNANEYTRMNNAPPNVFEKVLENVEKLVEEKKRQNKNVKLRVSFVCTKENYKRMPEKVKLAQQLGVDEVYFLNLIPVGKEGFTSNYCLYEDDQDVVEVVKTLNEFRPKISIMGPKLYKRNFDKRILHCSQPFTWLTVIPNGDVYTCCCAVTHAGNVFTNNNIWNSHVFQQARKEMVDSSLMLPEICKTCPNFVGM